MRTSTILALMTCSTFLAGGSCQMRAPANDKPLFCDVEEPRRFDPEELRVRAEKWPENLRRDHKTNLTWDRECPDGKSQERQ